MRWFLLVIILIWLIVAILAVVVVFYLTKNPLSFSLFSTLAPPAYILYRITKYLFRDNMDFQLEAMKIQMKMQKKVRILQINKEKIQENH